MALVSGSTLIWRLVLTLCSTKTGDIEDFPGWKGKLACYPVSVEGEDVMIHATPEMLGKQLVSILILCLPSSYSISG